MHMAVTDAHVFVDGVTRTCYELIARKRTWSSAKKDCRGRGGDLADVTSATEQDMLHGKQLYFYNQSVWLGLNDRMNEELFRWTSGLFHRFLTKRVFCA